MRCAIASYTALTVQCQTEVAQTNVADPPFILHMRMKPLEKSGSKQARASTPHLHVAELDRGVILRVCSCLLKQVFDCSDHHSPGTFVLEADVCQRVRLSRAGLPVCEYSPVVPLKHALQEGNRPS